MANFSKFRSGVILLAAAAGLSLAPGCEDIDWDWEARWWQRQPRKVAPDRTVRADSRRDAPAAPSEPPPSTTPSPAPPPEPQPAEARIESAPGTPEVLASSEARPSPAPVARSEPAPQPPPSRPAPPPPARPADTRAESTTPAPGAESFHQIYFSSGETAPRAGATGTVIQLRHVPARAAAQIIAQLYLPIGLGGGDDQHYLIYQDSAEYDAAKNAVAWIDVSPDAAPGGSHGTMNDGVVKLVEIVRSGGAPSRDAVQECRATLDRAAAGPDLGAASRWAAAMLAGRLAAEQLFDYDAARLAYDEAARHAAPGSVQMLATDWARAESYGLGGDKQAARQEYERIANEYGSHPGAQAVRRAKAALLAKGR